MVLTSLAIAGCVTFVSLSLATTVLNLLIIIAVLKDPLKKLRTLFNYLLLHLCVCNFIAGVVCFPIFAYYYYCEGLIEKKDLRYVVNLSYVAALGSAFSLSVDRYRAIRDPINHRYGISIKTFILYTITIWVYAVIGSVGHFLFGVVFTTVFQISTLAFMILALVTNSSQLDTRRKNGKKVLTTCTIILVFQLSSLIPVCVLAVFEWLDYPSVSLDLMYALNVFESMTAVVDPLICIIRLKNFRESIRHLCGRREEP